MSNDQQSTLRDVAEAINRLTDWTRRGALALETLAGVAESVADKWMGSEGNADANYRLLREALLARPKSE